MNIPILTGIFGLLLASSVMAQDGGGANAASDYDDAASRDPGSIPASSEIRQMQQWVIRSGDNDRLPFVLIDKVNAMVYVFNSAGHLQGAAAALLGMASGDASIPGIGSRSLSEIGAQDRITPSGRFVSSLSYDNDGKKILVIDNAQALSLHPVVKGTPAERRAERLQSSTPRDNRISFGCINVPVQFFNDIVSPAFAHSNGVVYILPETRPLQTLFEREKRQDDASGTRRSGNPLLNPSTTGKPQDSESSPDR